MQISPEITMFCSEPQETTFILPTTDNEIAISHNISQKLLNYSQSSTALWGGLEDVSCSLLISFSLDIFLNLKSFILVVVKGSHEL